MISQKTIQEVISTAKIEEVIGDFINLKRRGVNLIGLCPFHDEKTPSFTVSPAKNIYKCFGCSKGGDPVRFIMDHESMSYPESIRFLAQKYKIEIEETELSPEAKDHKNLADSLYIINEFAKDTFIKNLWEREEGKTIGLSYFKERGYREHTIKKFELGYALDARDEFTQKAITKQYNIEYLRSLGLTSKSDLDFFRARVMFPIHSISGKILGFGGRTLSSDKKIPKYINSPESEIYNKRNILYGMFFAKEAIRKEDECILVEGYTDVITLHQGELYNVVSSSGTALTKEQIKLIKRYTQNIKIIYDGDAAGIKAALRGLDLVLESDMNVKLVLLPENEDPDSFLAKSGTEKFKTYLNENEEDFVFFKTRTLLADTGNDPIKKTLILRDIVGSIAKISDSIKRTLYIRQCSRMLEMSEDILISETNKYIKEDLKKQSLDYDRKKLEQAKIEESWITETPLRKADDESKSYFDSDAHQEKAIAYIIINYGHQWYDETSGLTMAKYIVENIAEILDTFDVMLYQKIINLAIDTIDKGLEFSHSIFTSHEDEEIKRFAIDSLSFPYEYANWEKHGMILQTQKMPDENYISDSHSAILRLKLRKAKKTIASIETVLSKATTEFIESDEYLIHIKIHQELIKERNKIAAELRTVTLI